MSWLLSKKILQVKIYGLLTEINSKLPPLSNHKAKRDLLPWKAWLEDTQSDLPARAELLPVPEQVTALPGQVSESFQPWTLYSLSGTDCAGREGTKGKGTESWHSTWYLKAGFRKAAHAVQKTPLKYTMVPQNLFFFRESNEANKQTKHHFLCPWCTICMNHFLFIDC